MYRVGMTVYVYSCIAYGVIKQISLGRAWIEFPHNNTDDDGWYGFDEIRPLVKSVVKS